MFYAKESESIALGQKYLDFIPTECILWSSLLERSLPLSMLVTTIVNLYYPHPKMIIYRPLSFYRMKCLDSVTVPQSKLHYKILMCINSLSELWEYKERRKNEERNEIRISRAKCRGADSKIYRFRYIRKCIRHYYYS